MIAEQLMQAPNINKEEKSTSQERFGISDFEKWLSKTEGKDSEKPGNFARYQQRTTQLLMTALDVLNEQHPRQENFLKNWIKYKHNRETYYDELGTKLRENNIEDISIMDVGAGYGSLYSSLEHSSCRPKEYIAIEPTYKIELQDRFPDINVIEANSKEKAIPDDITADVVYVAGVAPYYQWESNEDSKGFKAILEDLEKHCNPGGVIVFSFTLDTQRSLNPNKLSATLRQMYEETHGSGYQKTKSRFSEEQLQELGYSVGPEIFIGTYVAYKHIESASESS